MDLKNSALILEGGGLRGVYTSGALRFFMDQGLFFPYVIGVSMGACNAANYVSRQPERNRIVNIGFVNDSRYLSYLRLLAGGELFGMKFIFDTIPNSLIPFDYQTFRESDTKCITVVTNCKTGEPLYFDKSELGEDYLSILQASTCLPFISKPVQYNGQILMDGGISDSIPIRKSIGDGKRKNVLILTQPKGYRKKQSRLNGFARMRYPRFPGLCEALANRYIRYNETMDFIDALEQQSEVFIIRPRSALPAGRIERNKNKLYATYDQGYLDASESYEELCRYLTNPPSTQTQPTACISG
ncbi:MAG: patatin family protein [Thermodesulfobacteriota bacterium]|nr:patatin family protein [Thermodesulfobacteriota bacterium]